MAAYIDTSALAKWYLSESGSDEFEAWIHGIQKPTISSLSMAEMRCLLARRRRLRILDREEESSTYALFMQDVAERHLTVEPVNDTDVRAAVHLIDRIEAHPLRPLDAIHLSICTAREMDLLATADTMMAAAAEEIGLEVVRFI